MTTFNDLLRKYSLYGGPDKKHYGQKRFTHADVLGVPTTAALYWNLPIPEGYIVVDVDDPAASPSLDGVDLGQPITYTPSGGQHHIFKLPQGFEIPSILGVDTAQLLVSESPDGDKVCHSMLNPLRPAAADEYDLASFERSFDLITRVGRGNVVVAGPDYYLNASGRGVEIKYLPTQIAVLALERVYEYLCRKSKSSLVSSFII